jgi:hypothetical protein
MPFTLSHPAAVLPFFRFTGHSIYNVALIIGSVSPDFGYYLRMFHLATFAHSLIGSLILCVPTGLLFLVCVIIVRKPFLWLMPSRVRAILSDALTFPAQRKLIIFLKFSFWIWIGALTHILWDSFTHKTGWFVEHVQMLQSSLVLGSGYSFPVYYILQQLSTVLGIIIVIALTFRAVSRQSPVSEHAKADFLRYWFWITLIALSIGLAVPYAISYASHFEGLLRFRSFVFQTGILSGAIFAVLTIISLAIASLRTEK